MEIRADGVEVGLGLRGSDAGLEMAHGLKQREAATRAHVVSIEQVVFNERDKEIGIEKHEGSVEFRRGDAEDGEGMPVNANDTVDHAAIVLKTGMPIGVGEYDIGSAVGPMLIGRVEELAKIWVKAEGIEVVAAGFLDPGTGWISACVEAGPGDVIGYEAVEAAIAIAQIDVVEIGLMAGGLVCMLEGVEAVGTGHIEQTQNEGIHDAEDNGIGADCQCKSKDCGEGESWRTAQLAQGEAEIGQYRFERGPLPDFAAALLNQGQVAKRYTRLAPGFDWGEAFALELLNTLFHVEAHFFGKIVVEFAATKDGRHPVHWNLRLAGRRIARIEDERNALKHTFEAGDLLFEMAKAGGGDLVGPDAPIGGGDSPLGFD